MLAPGKSAASAHLMGSASLHTLRTGQQHLAQTVESRQEAKMAEARSSGPAAEGTFRLIVLDDVKALATFDLLPIRI